VPTHISQRYDSGNTQRPNAEAATASGGQVVLAHDMTRSPFPPAPAGASPGHPGPGGTTPNGDRMPVVHAVSHQVILDQDGTGGYTRVLHCGSITLCNRSQT
jgi:hypothetical protein